MTGVQTCALPIYVAEREGYYHTGVRASVTATPAWLMQPDLSLQLDRAQSGSRMVKLVLSTSVSAQPAPVPSASVSSHKALSFSSQTPNGRVPSSSTPKGKYYRPTAREEERNVPFA